MQRMGMDTESGPEDAGQIEARRAAMIADAKAAIVAAGPLLTAAEVTTLLRGADPSQIPDLIALQMDGGERLYPAFQFDKDAGRVRAVVLEVNGPALLAARDEPWPVAGWWTQPDARLDGRSPASLLGSADEHMILVMARGDISDWA